MRKQYVFVLPAAVWVLIFTVFPLLYAVRMSLFTSYLGTAEQFVGRANFQRAWTDYRLWEALRVTAILVASSVTATVVLGLLLAVHFNQRVRRTPLLHTLLTMPLFATPIAIGYLAVTIYSEDTGPLNALLTTVGLPHLPWLSSPVWAVVAVALTDVWQWTPFCLLIFLVALQSVPEELYEAARLDTTSHWHLFRALTLPLMAPTIVIVVILRVIEAVKIVDVPLRLTAGGPGMATQTYSFLVYLEGVHLDDPGYASALASLSLVLIALVAALYFAFARRREVFD